MSEESPQPAEPSPGGRLPVAEGKGIVYGLFVPNAPNLIDPDSFGGIGRTTVAALRALELVPRVRPEVLLVSSPHFVSRGTLLAQASPRPRCLHDFGGMPRSLDEVSYTPPGEPRLASMLVEEGQKAGLPVATTTEWGLDHGAWAPLMHLAPAADVPVVPLSIADLPPQQHIAWGRAIRAAVARAERRAVFVATGSITHRLDLARFEESATWSEGELLESEMVDLIVAGHAEELSRYDRAKWATAAPEGELLPLFTLLGAIGGTYRSREAASGQAFGAAGLTILEFVPSTGESGGD